MKVRTFLTATAAAAAALVLSPSAALAQQNYKSEYRLSLVLGPHRHGAWRARSGRTW